MGVIRQDSYFNSNITTLNIKWEKKKESERIEVFNYKDKEGIKKFKEITENTTSLSTIFNSNKSIHKQTKQFVKQFNQILNQCVKKIQIKPAKYTQIDQLFRKQKELKIKTD